MNMKIAELRFVYGAHDKLKLQLLCIDIEHKIHNVFELDFTIKYVIDNCV